MHTYTPRYLLLLLDELRFMGNFENLDRQLAELSRASNISELYGQFLGRLQHSFDVVRETGHNMQLVERLMSIICLSRRGFTENELLACLGVTQATLSPLLYVFARKITHSRRLCKAHAHSHTLQHGHRH